MNSQLDGVVAGVFNFPAGRFAFKNPDTPPRAFTGFDLGPFFVHVGLSDDGSLLICNNECDGGLWNVTHKATGFCVQRSIPNQARAIWLAKKLLPLACWEGTTKAEVLRAVIPEILAQINVLRADAMGGDCQGEVA